LSISSINHTYYKCKDTSSTSDNKQAIHKTGKASQNIWSREIINQKKPYTQLNQNSWQQNRNLQFAGKQGNNSLLVHSICFQNITEQVERCNQQNPFPICPIILCCKTNKKQKKILILDRKRQPKGNKRSRNDELAEDLGQIKLEFKATRLQICDVLKSSIYDSVLVSSLRFQNSTKERNIQELKRFHLSLMIVLDVLKKG